MKLTDLLDQIDAQTKKWQHVLDWLSNYDSESDDNA